MARTDLDVINVSAGPVDPDALETAPDAVDGAMFENNGGVLLLVRNDGLAPHTLTVVTPRQIDGLAVADLAIDIVSGQTLICGPFNTQTYNRTAGVDTGKVYVDADGDQSELAMLAFRV